MKKNIYLFLAIITILISCHPTYVVQNPSPAPPPPPQPVDQEVTYQTFYDDLSPYGQWVDYPGYGYVWAPNVTYGFKPYATNGHWVYSSEGWVWASDYPWGWATFHYGRWFFDNAYGWMWVPGYEWAPAWVSWRRNEEYYGWAPLSPGVSINISFSNYNPPHHYWCFVPHQYVASQNINNYYVNETKNVTIINNTTVINNNITNNYNITNNRINNTTVRNNVYAPGPDPNEVSRAAGTNLRPVAIANSQRPGQQINNGQVSLFRPRVNPGSVSGSTSQQLAPSRVQPLRNLSPIQNNSTAPQNTHSTEPSGINANPANNSTPAANQSGMNNSPFYRPNNTPAANNRSNNNPTDDNRPSNRPVIQPPVNNPSSNSNVQPNNYQQMNRSNVQPSNPNPANSLNRNNNNNNQFRNNQNQSGSQFNGNRQNQQRNPNQVKPQPVPPARQNFNRPPLNRDNKPKEKPKDENHQ